MKRFESVRVGDVAQPPAAANWQFRGHVTKSRLLQLFCQSRAACNADSYNMMNNLFCGINIWRRTNYKFARKSYRALTWLSGKRITDLHRTHLSLQKVLQFTTVVRFLQRNKNSKRTPDLFLMLSQIVNRTPLLSTANRVTKSPIIQDTSN